MAAITRSRRLAVALGTAIILLSTGLAGAASVQDQVDHRKVEMKKLGKALEGVAGGESPRPR